MPCESKVRVWSDNKNVEVAYKLLCEGRCEKGDAKDCEPTHAAAGINITLHYCGCDGGKTEVKGCHILLREVKEDDGSSYTYPCSESGCDADKGEECTPVPGTPQVVPIHDKKGRYRGKLGKYIDYKCECKPKPKK